MEQQTYRASLPWSSSPVYRRRPPPDELERLIAAHTARVGASDRPEPRYQTDDDKRLRVAQAVLRDGPLTLTDALYAARCNRARLRRLLDHPWFTLEGGRVGLTEAGRLALRGEE